MADMQPVVVIPAAAVGRFADRDMVDAGLGGGVHEARVLAEHLRVVFRHPLVALGPEEPELRVEQGIPRRSASTSTAIRSPGFIVTAK